MTEQMLTEVRAKLELRCSNSQLSLLSLGSWHYAEQGVDLKRGVDY